MVMFSIFLLNYVFLSYMKNYHPKLHNQSQNCVLYCILEVFVFYTMIYYPCFSHTHIYIYSAKYVLLDIQISNCFSTDFLNFIYLRILYMWTVCLLHLNPFHTPFQFLPCQSPTPHEHCLSNSWPHIPIFAYYPSRNTHKTCWAQLMLLWFACV